MDVLITGASGFLGSSILKALTNHHFITLGRTRGDIIVDLSRQIPSIPQVDCVINAAGKAHSIPKSEREKEEFFEVNVKGTLNLLSGLEQLPYLPKSFVFISSVAVYGLQSGIDIDENTPLLAKDPYGLSKIKAEQVVTDWCAKNNVICTILRLPLLAGPNPPGNLGEMINGIKKGYYMNIAGGTAKKSMVLVNDVASILPKALHIAGIYNLTDGYHPTFNELSSVIAFQLDKSKIFNMPLWVAKSLANLGDLIDSVSPINSVKLKKIMSDLTFDDSKARKLLDWKPNRVLEEFKIK